ncbi:haloacid dehalogenase-like hydrolase domain-containing protein [Phthorimaea operculella]|nr:haloacid dehalogenase-like hydrolase domain-containing protein [Phthorimaea operculella]
MEIRISRHLASCGIATGKKRTRVKKKSARQSFNYVDGSVRSLRLAGDGLFEVRGVDFWPAVNQAFQKFEAYKNQEKVWQADNVTVDLEKHKYQKVTHCFFDLDGTILDSEITYHRMLAQICEEFGHKYTKELREKVYGGTDKDICMKVVHKLQLPITAAQLEDRLNQLSKKYLACAPLRPGAERLLNHLYNHGIPFCLATNSSAKAVRIHEMSRPKLFSLFHHKVCATDPELLCGKPQPDIYLLAMNRFNDPNLKPKNCLVFEDSVTGVRAGRAAGMQVVMIPQKEVGQDMYRHATLVIKSLQKFRPEQFGLPPFSDKVARRMTTMWQVNEEVEQRLNRLLNVNNNNVSHKKILKKTEEVTNNRLQNKFLQRVSYIEEAHQKFGNRKQRNNRQKKSEK